MANKTAYDYACEWNKEYKEYEKLFSKYGVSICEMARMQEAIDSGKYRLTFVHELFGRTPSGNWKTRPIETETKEISVKHYLNIISSIPCFGDRVSKTYTKYGYIPYKLSCVSWGLSDKKSVRTFKFESL